MNIISASRRTDIPAFYTPWFINRLDAGYACYSHPYSGRMHRVSLRPEDVHSVVFWSKDYRPLLPHLDVMHSRGYRTCFHYTITGLPRWLEPYAPPWREAATVFRELAQRTSPRHVMWRFDPIVCTDRLGTEHFVGRFDAIAHALTGATQRCYFSFATFYGKVARRLRGLGIAYVDPPLEEKRALAAALADVAAGYGIGLYACCQDLLVTDHVRKAHCIDGGLLSELFPDRPPVLRLAPTRSECGCAASRDVGAYDSCLFDCVYCYANGAPESALAHYHAHQPEHESLRGGRTKNANAY